jgi:hypothetical protein
MLDIQTLNDNCTYILDLLQLYDGARLIRIRQETDQVEESAVFSTVPMSGRELRLLLSSNRPIPLVGCGSFVIDEQDTWMTPEESAYWHENHTPSALHDPYAPWVNDLPPRLAGS